MGIRHAVRTAVITTLNFPFEIIYQIDFGLFYHWNRNGNGNVENQHIEINTMKWNQWNGPNALIYVLLFGWMLIFVLWCGLIDIHWMSQSYKRHRCLCARIWFACSDIMSPPNHSRPLSVNENFKHQSFSLMQLDNKVLTKVRSCSSCHSSIIRLFCFSFASFPFPYDFDIISIIDCPLEWKSVMCAVTHSMTGTYVDIHSNE